MSQIRIASGNKRSCELSPLFRSSLMEVFSIRCLPSHRAVALGKLELRTYAFNLLCRLTVMVPF